MQKKSSFRPKKRPYGRRSSSSRYFRKQVFTPRFNKNEYIRSEKVQVVDQDGNNIGEIATKDALALARKVDLDLVEVAPKAKPPVCKIMSWSKFLYEQKKKEKKARKNKQKDQKEFRFGTFIADGDRDRHVKRAKEFLDKGHNVKLTVTRRRRTPYSHSKDLLNELLTLFSEYSTIDSRPSSEGRRISIVFKGFSGKSKVDTLEKDAKVKDKQDSSKEIQKDKTKGRKGSKDSVQQKQTGSSSDKKISKDKKQDSKKK